MGARVYNVFPKQALETAQVVHAKDDNPIDDRDSEEDLEIEYDEEIEIEDVELKGLRCTCVIVLWSGGLCFSLGASHVRQWSQFLLFCQRPL